MVQRLVTHSGSFHADDLFAATALRVLFPDAPIQRTRDADTLRDALKDPNAVVFDVGAVLDTQRHNYDHHQAEFDARRPNRVPYSSFGLVWRQWGTEICAQLLSAHAKALTPSPSIDPKAVAQHVDRTLVQPIDAADNGEASTRSHLKGAPETSLRVLHMGVLVHDFNPPNATCLQDYDNAFQNALPFAHTVLTQRVLGAHTQETTRALVRAHDDGSSILRLPRNARWQGFTAPHHLFVIYPTEGGNWMAQCVPEPHDPMTPKLPFPPEWAGLRDRELDQVCGLQGTVFCHRKRFIAGAENEGTIQSMVRTTLATYARS